jgi:hypothetical protein
MREVDAAAVTLWGLSVRAQPGAQDECDQHGA